MLRSFVVWSIRIAGYIAFFTGAAVSTFVAQLLLWPYLRDLFGWRIDIGEGVAIAFVMMYIIAPIVAFGLTIFVVYHIETREKPKRKKKKRGRYVEILWHN